jgi:ubiquinone/menaquinone biosynthesis C-methylase UbiE
MTGSKVYRSLSDPGQLFDSLASAYDAWFEMEGELIFAIEVQALAKVLPILPKPWIEVGVGSGRFAHSLGIGLGLDPSIKLLDMARKRDINVLVGRGEDSPIRDGSFGTAFFIVTLCFVQSPLKVLIEANRLLKRGGKAVLGLVLRESPWGRFYQAKGEGGHRFYQHATFYSYDEVETLLEQAGFEIERVISTLFQKPGDVEHMESPQEGFSPDAGFAVIVAGRSLTGCSGN